MPNGRCRMHGCALETWALFCRDEQKRARELLIQSRELLKQMQIG
jgi:hypothetical protein